MKLIIIAEVPLTATELDRRCGINAGYVPHNQEKEEDYYAKNKERAEKRQAARKAYLAEYRIRNSTKIKESNAEYRIRNSEKIKIYAANWKITNVEQVKLSHERYYAKNLNRITANRHKRRKENPEIYRERSRISYLNNIERIKENRRVDKLENPEKFRLRARQERLKNPERGRIGSRNYRSSKFKTVSEPYTTQQILDLYGSNCHICDEPIDLDALRSTGKFGWESGLHLDHVVPLSRGGSNLILNIKPSHALCNLKKNTRLVSC